MKRVSRKAAREISPIGSDATFSIASAAATTAGKRATGSSGTRSVTWLLPDS